MIQLEHLHIEDFRGIRVIDLPLNSKSFAVHGPNGSGKSGVVDAIEFGLTGVISRLAGTGTGNVSLLKHGPHVHKRDDPAAAVVALTVRDVDTNATAVIRRSIKDPNNFELEPDTPEMRQSIAQAQAHPELTLSRREIIQFVISKPADRARQVQALLKLERLDEFRRLLKTTQGKATTSYKSATAQKDNAENLFKGLLGTTSLLESEILREVNLRRKVLDAPALSTITVDTNLEDGLSKTESPALTNLTASKTDTQTLLDVIAGFADIETKRGDLVTELAAFDKPGVSDALTHRQLIASGLRSIDDNLCPLCDKEWDSFEELRDHLQAKLDASEEAEAAAKKVVSAANLYKDELRNSSDPHGVGSVYWAPARLVGKYLDFSHPELLTFVAMPTQADSPAAAVVTRSEKAFANGPRPTTPARLRASRRDPQ